MVKIKFFMLQILFINTTYICFRELFERIHKQSHMRHFTHDHHGDCDERVKSILSSPPPRPLWTKTGPCGCINDKQCKTGIMGVQNHFLPSVCILHCSIAGKWRQLQTVCWSVRRGVCLYVLSVGMIVFSWLMVLSIQPESVWHLFIPHALVTQQNSQLVNQYSGQGLLQQ